MGGAVCSRLVRGKVGRFTKIDRCGAPFPGPLSTVVTEGLISATLTPTNDAGNPIVVPNAGGKNLINNVPTPKFQYFTASIALLGVNPVLVTMLTGQELWPSADPSIYSGFVISDDADPDLSGFGMELWSGVDGNVCTDTGNVGFGYFATPFLKGGVIDAITWANDAINFTITGAVTTAPNDWGVGPYDVTLDELGDPSPLLKPFPARGHFLSDIVYLAPPVDECGGSSLGVKATGATAGTPGTFTGGYAPLNLPGMTGVAATPNTAWGVGEYVETYDGTHVKWDGTAWITT